MSADVNPKAAPRWVADAFHKGLEEFREFFATSIGFVRSPRQFADEWYRGERRAMNPAGCVAAAAAIALPTNDFLDQWLPVSASSNSLGVQILGAIGPYLYYAALGAVAHPFFRVSGSTRPISSSIGVALFAGALPGLGSSLLGTASAVLAAVHGEFEHGGEIGVGQVVRSASLLLLMVTVCGGFLLFAWSACAGLAGLHRVRIWRAIVSLSVAFFVTGLMLGEFHPPGHYGLHLTLKLWEAGRFIEPQIFISIS